MHLEHNVRLKWRYGGKRAVLRGEHVISRKATAQGMSDVLRCPVCSCAHYLYHCTRDRGCSAHPAFPAPSDLREGAKITCKARAQCVARLLTHIQLSSPGLTGRPSIPETLMIEPRSRGVLGPPPEPVIRAAIRPTRWRRTTAVCGTAPSTSLSATSRPFRLFDSAALAHYRKPKLNVHHLGCRPSLPYPS